MKKYPSYLFCSDVLRHLLIEKPKFQIKVTLTLLFHVGTYASLPEKERLLRTSRRRVGTTNPMSHFDIGIIKHGGSFSGVAFLDLLKENSCDGKWMQL